MSAKVKQYFLSGLFYLVAFVVIAQGINWWKSRDAMTGNLSEFNVELMNGTRFTISELSGEPVLFHFWATWCTYCKKMEADTFRKTRACALENEKGQGYSRSWNSGARSASYLIRDLPEFVVSEICSLGI